MRLQAALLAALAVGMAIATHARPVVQPYLGHAGLAVPLAAKPGPNTGSVSHSYHHTRADGRVLHLDLQGDLADDGVIHLDSDTSIDQVHCNLASGQLVVIFAAGHTVSSLGWTVQNLIVGDRRWACTDADGNPASIIRRITAIDATKSAAGVLIVETIEAKLHHVYRNLNLKYACNQFPNGTKVTTHATVATDEVIAQHQSNVGGSGRRLWFWDTIVNDVKRAVRAIVSVGEALYDAAGLLVSGDANVDTSVNLAAISWNYDPVGDKPLHKYNLHGPTVNPAISSLCTHCYAYADLMLVVEASISDYSLESAKVALQGQANVAVEMSLLPNAAELETPVLKKDFDLATIHLPSVELPIGVPMYIAMEVPIKAALDAKISLDLGTVQFSYKRSEAVTYGFTYAESTGLNWLHEHSTTTSHSMNIQPTLQSTLEVSAAVIPTLQATVDELGELNVEFDPTVTAHLVDSVDGCQLSAQLDLDLALKLSASIKIVNVKWGPRAWPLWSGNLLRTCISGASYSQSLSQSQDTSPGSMADTELASGSSASASSASGIASVASQSSSSDSAAPATGAGRLLAASSAVSVGSAPTCRSACLVASGLTTCAHLNGLPVCTSMSMQQMLAADQSIASAAAAAGRGAGAFCADSYLRYMCDTLLPKCDQSSTPAAGAEPALVPISMARCQSMYTTCDAQPNVARLMCQQCAANGLCPVSSAISAVPADVSVPPAPVATSQCVQVPSTIDYCEHLAGQSVYLRTDLFPSVEMADAAAANLMDSTFTASSRCLRTFKVMACQRMMPLCGSHSQRLPLCFKACVTAASTCSNATAAAAECAAQAAKNQDIAAEDTSAECGLAGLEMSSIVVGGPLKSSDLAVKAGGNSAASGWEPKNWSIPSIVIGAACVVAAVGLVSLAAVLIIRRRRQRGGQAAPRNVVVEWTGTKAPVSV